MKHTSYTLLMSVFAFIAFVQIVVIPISGQSLREFTLNELAVESSDIVVANVVLTESHWNANQTRIYTEIEIEVLENIHGDFNKGDHFKIFYLGGSLDGVTTFAIDLPVFVKGKQSVLFLNRLESTQYGEQLTVFGTNQGKFDIYINRGIQKVIRHNVPIPLRNKKGGNRLPISDTISMPLQEFINNIKSFTP